MDDDDDKARRNLVVVSSAILVSAWLDIPFSTFFEKLFVSGSAQPDSYKVWAVWLVVFAYLGLRYSFSGEGTKYRKELENELQILCTKNKYALAQSQADWYTKTGREPEVFGGKFCQFVTDGVTTSANLVGSEPPQRPQVSLEIFEQLPDPWRFRMSTTLTWYENGRMVRQSGGASIEVRIDGYRRWQVEARSRVNLWLYSASSIKYLIPVLLATAAVGTICWKVGRGYYAAAF